ncbi:uncharacterized protein A4U43_C04F9960 [Asparagus officinalis]|uniref:Glycosyltransferase N-terminal domain-containing protein n=1 Tax=Asparagus officinalis TaxID=4686 RepID=A0A5P1EZQ0_ASPOF|nr:uncharacterized protein A4U43_C04F9960 [Asparagus officinalis]
MAEHTPNGQQAEKQSVLLVALPSQPKATSTNSSTSPFPPLFLHISPSTSPPPPPLPPVPRPALQGWPPLRSPDPLPPPPPHSLPLPLPTPPPLTNPLHLLPPSSRHAPLQSPLTSLLRSLSLSSRRLVVVHDPLMRFACAEADSIPNAETYEFQCVTASYQLSFFTDELENIGDKLSREVRNVVLTQFPDCYPEDFWVFLAKYRRELSSRAGVVMNTCKEIDGEFIELMPHVPRYRNKKLFAIGPMSPVSASGGDHDRHECLHWTSNRQNPSSTFLLGAQYRSPTNRSSS